MRKLGGYETMTGKERVKAALAHEPVDRVPIDYSANAGIHQRMLDYFGLSRTQNLALREALGVDFARAPLRYTGPRMHAELPGRQVDAWGRRKRWIEHGSGGYWDFCDFPLKDADEETIANWPMPNPDHYDYAALAAFCKAHPRFAIVAGEGPDIINSTGMIRGMEQTLIDLMTDDPAGMLLIGRRTKILLAIAERMLAAAVGGIDVWWMGEDLGTQIAPIISLERFRKHIRPRHQPFVDLARAYNLPTIIHSCGSSSWAFEDFIEMGITGVDALQPEAANMAPQYLKQRFGGRLAFHGCISTAGPVATGTVEETTEYRRRTLEIMKPGGGYCFSPTHMLQDNSPTENVLAMYEAAHQYGRY